MANTFTEEQLIQYDRACDLIADLVALKSSDIHEERCKPDPDERRIAQLEEDQFSLMQERKKIRIEDSETVQRVIAHYKAKIRARG